MIATAAVLQTIAFVSLAQIRVVPDTPPEAAGRDQSGVDPGDVVGPAARRPVPHLCRRVLPLRVGRSDVRAARAGLPGQRSGAELHPMRGAGRRPAEPRLGDHPGTPGGLADLQTNPLLAWAVIRASWGVDPLLLAVAPFWPTEAIWIAAACGSFGAG